MSPTKSDPYLMAERRAMLPRCSRIMFALAIISAVLFWKMPVTQVTDSQFSLLLSHAMVFDQTTRLDPFLNPRIYPPKRDFFYWFWQLSPKHSGKVTKKIDGHWDGKTPLYYGYPNFPSLLSAPVVLLTHALGWHIVDASGYYQYRVEHVVHRLLAAILGGIIVALIFRMASLLLPISWAIGAAVLLGYGTQVVSTLSRGVWSDTWAVLFSLIALHHILAHALGKVRLRPIVLVVMALFAFFCKPHYGVVGVAAFIYLLLNLNRQQWLWLVGLGTCLLALFMAVSWVQFGTLIPDYYYPVLNWQYFPKAFPGHLFSPSRGLFVFSPFLFFVLYVLIRYRHTLVVPQLVKITIIPVSIIMLVSSTWGVWWGGLSYGPRLITPLLPWIVLLTIIALEVFGRNLDKIHPSPISSPESLNATTLSFSWQGIKKNVMISLLLLVTSVISIFINIQGAAELKTWKDWFYLPYPVFYDPEKRVWDWHDPIFLAGIIQRPHEKKTIKKTP